jgi:Mn2+/Fe2+ NRAMP family transporter
MLDGMLIANNRKVMGERVNGLWTNLGGWVTTVVMFAAAIALLLTWAKR